MINKIVYFCPFLFKYAADPHKNQKMCDESVSENLFLLKYCPDRYKTQEKYNKAVYACLLVLKFIPDWSVTSKMLEALNKVIISNNDINRDFTDSNIVRFFGDNMDILSVDLNNINLDVNFDEHDPKTIIHVTYIAWNNKLKQRKAFKNEIRKELMLAAWHPTR